jgi:capsule biosynthesis phosphatase
VTATVLPVLSAWLARHDVPFDELHVGKPWAGRRGYYIDDRAVRPREFLDHSFDDLDALIRQDRVARPAEADDTGDAGPRP